MPNRLQHETSPYLLQHANNPVDWYPWSNEAFQRAQDENKPVLVSIGYAACHWCHVMEHESFEDDSVAAFMNEHFINIKVDREEHPDVDHLYMDALQAMTGAGGWPLNMFVTPDRKPFYGGTYFPPKSMYGRSSWMEIVTALHRAWLEKPEEVQLQSTQMLAHLKQASLIATVKPDEKKIEKQDIETIVKNLLQQADREFGGFGGAPKFPATGAIQFLLEYYHFQKDKENGLATAALEHALLSLNKMIEGGIYDQIGGGFSRYATDNDWLVPHFEKMLYDNALLLDVLSFAYQITKEERYRRVITETIDFCNRELRSADAEGFYCALDADSEGVEGKYYTWTWQDWKALMNDVHPAVAAYFGVQEDGNWEHTNILNEAIPTATILETYSLSAKAWDEHLTVAKNKLFTKRQERIRPSTDDKILLSWNALMNIALVKAATALDEERYLQQAEKQIEWLLQTFIQGEHVNHTYKNGTAKITAKLDDYAYLIAALLQLASATGKEQYLHKANELMQITADDFINEDHNFFYFSSVQQTDIVVRKIELYDGATPAANSVMMENLWIMGNLYERSDWLEQSTEMMFAMKQSAVRYPTSFARWAIFIQQYEAGQKQLIIAGNQAEAILKDWKKEIHPEIYAFAQTVSSTLPALKNKYLDGGTLLYLCEGFACRQPVASLAALGL